MGRVPFKKKNKHNNFLVFPKTEEDIEDMKHIYFINGALILTLNKNIAGEIYNRLYN